MKKLLKKRTENIAADKKRAFGAAAKGSFFIFKREKSFCNFFAFSIVDFFESGNNGCDLFAFDFAVNIVFSDLINQRAENNNTDKVGDHHKAVEGIGNIPCKRGMKHRADKNYGYKNHFINNCSFCSEKIFPCFGAVNTPAESGGKSEKQNRYCYEH